MSGELVWAWPWAFAALPLPWLVRRFAPPARVPALPALRVPEPARFDLAGPAAAGTGKRRRPRLATLLLIGSWCALVVALARPQALGEPIDAPETGRDLLLGIDVSDSMAERDLYAGNRAATRLAVVREVATDFVRRRPDDRIGLVMFGTRAYVQTPLTRDHEAVLHFLDEAAIGLAGGKTALGDAIGLATKRLREREGEGRVLVLLTDGRASAGTVDPLEAARVAAAVGVRVYTIGVGGGRELDAGTLERIASLTGGRFFRARSRDELEAIYRGIDELEPTERAGAARRPLRELQAWPLAASLALSVGWAASARRGEGAEA